mgnify:CR=1 FL=1
MKKYILTGLRTALIPTALLYMSSCTNAKLDMLTPSKRTTKEPQKPISDVQKKLLQQAHGYAALPPSGGKNLPSGVGYRAYSARIHDDESDNKGTNTTSPQHKFCVTQSGLQSTENQLKYGKVPVTDKDLLLEYRSIFDSNIPIESVCPQLREKLKDPSYELSKEESVDLLMTCIAYGEANARKARDKELIIVIGNTGAGKSTFVNYLAGCEMMLKSPKSAGTKGYRKVFVVKPTSEGGPTDELMPIGHKKQSKTFMPQIETTADDTTYCDCPGFLDNRGNEINIANAVNIRRTLSQAKGVKVVILITYNPNDVRQSELSKMIHICGRLFGGVENIEQHKDAILLGVSKVSPKDDEFDAKGFKEWMAEGAPKIIKVLAERMFFFDPLDRPINGAWTREQCLKELAKLKPISKTNEIFKTVLTDSDKQALISISEELQKKILKSLKGGKTKEASNVYSHLLKLRPIDHPVTERVLSRVTRSIYSHYNQLVKLFREHCGFNRFEKADKLLEELRLAEAQKYFLEVELQKIYKADRLARSYEESRAEYTEEQRMKKELEETKKHLKAKEKQNLKQEKKKDALSKDLRTQEEQSQKEIARLRKIFDDKLKKNQEDFEKQLFRITQEKINFKERLKRMILKKKKKWRKSEKE